MHGTAPGRARRDTTLPRGPVASATPPSTRPSPRPKRRRLDARRAGASAGRSAPPMRPREARRPRPRWPASARRAPAGGLVSHVPLRGCKPLPKHDRPEGSGSRRGQETKAPGAPGRGGVQGRRAAQDKWDGEQRPGDGVDRCGGERDGQEHGWRGPGGGPWASKHRPPSWSSAAWWRTEANIRCNGAPGHGSAAGPEPARSLPRPRGVAAESVDARAQRRLPRIRTAPTAPGRRALRLPLGRTAV